VARLRKPTPSAAPGDGPDGPSVRERLARRRAEYRSPEDLDASLARMAAERGATPATCQLAAMLDRARQIQREAGLHR